MHNIKRKIAAVLLITICFLTTCGFSQKQILKEYSHVRYIVPENAGFKSFMDYEKITDETSIQYAVQQECITGANGIRQINGRYCIAIGTFFGANVGQVIDITLENGTVIPAVVGDIKADKDTTETDIFTKYNGCCSEFIVETNKLPSDIRRRGNVSKMYTKWDSPVYSFDVYDLYVDEL